MPNSVYVKEIGIGDMIDEVDRIMAGPDFELTMEFESILHQQFLDTQVRVASPEHHHVFTYTPTGNLQRSGHPESEYDGASMLWSGNITYGGWGIDREVEYAVYERARGGIHDFFGGLSAFEPEYEDAIIAFFQRGPG